MNRIAHLAAVGALLANTGCIAVSISPLCTAQEAVFEPALVGTWIESSSTRYALSKLGENAYKIEILDGNDRLTMTGRLTRLDGTLFLDVAPSGVAGDLGVPDQAAGIIRDWYVPLHFLVRVNQVTPSLSVSVVDEMWLKKYLEDHPSALAHTFRDSDVVLTGSTADLQKFFRAHANTPGAFEKPTVLTRQP